MLDYDLIRRAEQLATGATIHDVNGWLGCYKAAAFLLEQSKCTGKKRRETLASFHTWRARLESFTFHGDTRRAEKDHPVLDPILFADLARCHCPVCSQKFDPVQEKNVCILKHAENVHTPEQLILEEDIDQYTCRITVGWKGAEGYFKMSMLGQVMLLAEEQILFGVERARARMLLREAHAKAFLRIVGQVRSLGVRS